MPSSTAASFIIKLELHFNVKYDESFLGIVKSRKKTIAGDCYQLFFLPSIFKRDLKRRLLLNEKDGIFRKMSGLMVSRSVGMATYLNVKKK